MLGRGLRWVVAQLAFLGVLAVLAAGFGYLVVLPHRTGRGTGLIAAAMLLAAVVRGVVPSARVGLLAVRARWIDTVIYLVLGGVILGLDIRLHA